MKVPHLIVPLVLLLCASCNSSEKKAEALYAEAVGMYEHGDYAAAKLMVDSIKATYPKAFATRKKSISLMQRVELGEQLMSLAYLDSLEAVERGQFMQIKDNYKFIKNEDYQDIGLFIVPGQDLSRNLNRTMLYVSVDENGVMKLTSILCGSSIDHRSIKVVLKADGTFASTKSTNMFYASTHLGLSTEKAEFEVGSSDDGVAAFIADNKDRAMDIECHGTGVARRQLTRQEIDAVVKIGELAAVLASLHEIKEQKREVNNRLEFIKSRMDDGSTAAVESE